MKARELIAALDELRPNQYSREQKWKWLREIDAMTVDEILSTHAGTEVDTPAAHYGDDTPLLIEPPYGEGIYLNYLLSRMDHHNGESARYNASARLFAAAWQQYADYINRRYPPLGAQIRL